MGINVGKLGRWVLRQSLGTKRGDEIRKRLEQAVTIDPVGWEEVLNLADAHGVRGLLEKVKAAKDAGR